MKRKIFRKLMAASLAAAMVVSVAGCGNNNNGASSSGNGGNGASDSANVSTPGNDTPAPADNSEPEGEVSKYPVLNDPATGKPYDLGGMKITVWSWFTEGTSQDEYGEAVTEWRDWIQETYNFTYSMESLGSWSDCHTSFVDYVTTGGDDNNYIFVGNTAGGMTSAMQQGLAYDVATLDCLDFSERKFQLNGQCNQYKIGDHIYAFYAGFPEPRDGVYFNIRLLEQTTGLTADDIYDYQKNNEWTWAKFEEVLQKVNAGGDIDNDGVQDIYPFGCNRGSFGTASVYSNGSRYFGMDENGKYTYNVEDAATVEALEWAIDMMDKYLYPQPDGTEWDYFFPAFTQEAKIVFLPEQAYQMTGGGQFDSMEDEKGFVMFPMGPQADGYINPADDNVWMLPGCYDADRAWKIMFAYNLWTDPIPGYEDVNGHKAQYYDRADNIRTVDETIERMCSEGTTVKYESFIKDIDMGEPFLWKVNPGQDVQEMIEGISTAWQIAVEETNNSNQ